MNQYMLYIRNDQSSLPDDKEQEFLKACESYIEKLKAQGKLISAQPLAHDGAMIGKTNSEWQQTPYLEGQDANAGYYHIYAASLDEAIAMAKNDPEFTYRTNARIEVRPIKTEEDSTGYVYPTES